MSCQIVNRQVALPDGLPLKHCMHRPDVIDIPAAYISPACLSGIIANWGALTADCQIPLRVHSVSRPVTVEQHLVSRGVLKIQIGGGDSLLREYEVCQLKTLVCSADGFPQGLK